MIYYERIYHDEHIDRYVFYPNNDRNDPGYVEFKDGERVRVEPPKIDIDFNFFWPHTRKIDLTRDHGIVAWY